MSQQKSQKGLKLLQLREKLAKLNGHPVIGPSRQKLHELTEHNKKVES